MINRCYEFRIQLTQTTAETIALLWINLNFTFFFEVSHTFLSKIQKNKAISLSLSKNLDVKTTRWRSDQLFGPAAINQSQQIDIQRLESLQRRVSKIIVKSKCSRTSSDYFKFQSLEDRRNTYILSWVKRSLNSKVPQFLKNYFKLNKEVISRETRRSNFIYLTCSKKWDRREKFLL